MTVGKLKEYLNDIDDNVEIKGLLLRCENGYAIQSKMRWIDNEDIIAELDKMIIEIGNIEETKTYLNKTVFKNPQEIKNEVMELLNDRISELKEQ